ncbi:probable phosphatidylinositol 3,4,5-trisphosphate 3-phosphatase Tep1p [Monosporozyma servazzii]
MSSYHHHNLGLPTAIKKVSYSSINIYKNALGLSLDISLIDTGIMVCSYPVIGTNRQLVRNSLSDLITYLNVGFGLGNWKLYNLKSEIGEADYSEKDLFYRFQPPSCSLVIKHPFHQRVFNKMEISKYRVLGPMDPHPVINNLKELEKVFLRKGWLANFPPPFTLLQEIVDDMNNFLSMNDNHRCVIQSKKGRGRAGIIYVAFMMKHRKMSFENAMQRFIKNRFKRIDSDGVTNKSQLRYLQYHEYFLSLDTTSQNLLLNALKEGSSSVLTFIKVSNPKKILSNSFTTCWLTIKKYSPTRKQVMIIGTFNLTELINNEMKEGCDREDQGILKFPLLLEVSDIMLEFEIKTDSNDDINEENKMSCFLSKFKEVKKVYAWINVLLESVKIVGSCEQLQPMTRADGHFRAIFTWEELDKIPGSRKTGLKFFEYISLEFEQVSFSSKV